MYGMSVICNIKSNLNTKLIDNNPRAKKWRCLLQIFINSRTFDVVKPSMLGVRICETV